MSKTKLRDLSYPRVNRDGFEGDKFILFSRSDPKKAICVMYMVCYGLNYKLRTRGIFKGIINFFRRLVVGRLLLHEIERLSPVFTKGPEDQKDQSLKLEYYTVNKPLTEEEKI